MPFSFHKALFFAVAGVAACFPVPAPAIENGTTSTYNTIEPTSTNIPNWNTGWGNGSVTGWDYVGTVAGGGGSASGVYLGNGWVLTAGHVGPGTFQLGGPTGPTYLVVPGSSQGLSQSPDADVNLFQIAAPPSLPALNIATSPPTAFSFLQAGSSVAMLGYGESGGFTTSEAWGLNTVTQTDQTVDIQNTNFSSTDFETVYGTTTSGPSSVTNNYLLNSGDSGGGDFIYNSSSGQWQLAGINEALDGNNSLMIQLSTYASQINTITATPEPSAIMFPGLGVLMLLYRSRRAAPPIRSCLV
jgi:Trypsin